MARVPGPGVVPILPRSPELVLDVRHLSVSFPMASGEKLRAVRDVSFSIRRGESVGLVGESGSGKSVTALAILRLLPVAPRGVGGKVLFGTDDLLQLDGRHLRRIRGGRIGTVFQDPMSSLNPVLTVGRQISEMVRLHRHLDARAAERRTVELLERVEIPDAARRAGQYPHEFSGGMRQRAMIAMALSCDPELLIADEPTTALDVTIQAQILDLLRRLRQEMNMSILLITHDFGVVAGTTDRVNVMYAGRIVEAGLVDDVFERPQHPYTQGLLASLPRLGVSKLEPLTAIAGSPPDPRHLSSGCPFRPRCSQAIDRCVDDDPPLEAITGHTSAACWVAFAHAGRSA
jgi:oligopeptide transport system ATP-binding protein